MTHQTINYHLPTNAQTKLELDNVKFPIQILGFSETFLGTGTNDSKVCLSDYSLLINQSITFLKHQYPWQSQA